MHLCVHVYPSDKYEIKTHTQKYTVISYNNILYYIPTLKYQSSIIVVICDSNFPVTSRYVVYTILHFLKIIIQT